MKNSILLFLSLVSVLNLNAINIDGKLSETEWSKAKAFSGFSFLKSSGKSGRPEMDTEFKYFSDKNNVYFGIKCFENKMSKLRAKVHEGENNPWRDDVVELFLSPECLPANFYQFVVAAGGCKWQMYYEEKGVTKPDFYMPIYQAKVFKGKNFWSVEIKLPLKAFYMTPEKFWKNNWLVNIARNRRHKELTSWSKLNQSFHESDKFKTLQGFPAKQDNICIMEASLKTDAPKHGDITVKVQLEKAGKYNLNGKYFNFKNGVNKAVIKNVVFPATGKNKYKLTLKKNDRVVAERFYPVAVNYTPLAVEFTSPGYKDCFFPGQKAERLKGNIEAAGKTVIMVDGKKQECVNGKFDIDISKVKKDKFTVEFKSGAYRIKRIIRRLSPVKNKFYYINNNCLIANGKPIFILSWYGGNWWCCGREFRDKYPDNKDKHPCNVKGQVTLEPARLVRGIEAKEATKDVKPSPEIFSAVKRKIEKYRNKDFVWYYLSDEPECRGISPVYLKYIYDYVKELDPYHPVLIISRAPARYLNACDIMSPHPYLGPYIDDGGKRGLRRSVAEVAKMCRSYADVMTPGKVLMLTPQAFSYAFNNSYADYPTFDETNASVWAMICCGGKGLHPYVWHSHAERPELSIGCDYIFTSLNRLNKCLVEAGKTPPKNNPNVSAWKTKSMMAMVNLTPKPQTVTVKTSGMYYVFRGNGTIKADGKLTRKLAPYEVLVLTRQKIDKGLPSLNEVRKQIADAENARRNRGNILFGRGKDIELSFSSSRPYELFKPMAQQNLLFDGVLDVAGWMPRRTTDLWYEMAFPKFVPRFSKARIYGNALKGMTFKIWKRGEWKQPECKIKSRKYYMELDFGKTLSTVKIRMDFILNRKNMVDICEIELIK